MIEIHSLSHTFKGHREIKFDDWNIAETEKWLLLGQSGSGKTTLLHIMTGLLKPQKGSVKINGTDIYNLSARELDRFRGKNIGIIFQKPHLVASLTITENLQIAQTFAKLPVDKNRVKQALGSLGIAEKADSYPHQLSQGQLQRVSIARATINKPSLLLADEPTSSLDDKNAADVLQLLMEQSDLTGSTLIVATHDQRIKDRFTQKYILQ